VVTSSLLTGAPQGRESGPVHTGIVGSRNRLEGRSPVRVTVGSGP
jgi:hypothetical protein